MEVVDNQCRMKVTMRLQCSINSVGAPPFMLRSIGQGMKIEDPTGWWRGGPKPPMSAYCPGVL